MKKVMSLLAIMSVFAFAGCSKKKHKEMPHAKKEHKMKHAYAKKDQMKKSKKMKNMNEKQDQAMKSKKMKKSM